MSDSRNQATKAREAAWKAWPASPGFRGRDATYFEALSYGFDAGWSAALETAGQRICGVICDCGPGGEPLACAYEPDHDGQHSWATLPTFGGTDG